MMDRVPKKGGGIVSVSYTPSSKPYSVELLETAVTRTKAGGISKLKFQKGQLEKF
jgi:hypothetical protein